MQSCRQEGKKCLLVKNTCAWQLVLSGLDWLSATSLPDGSVCRLHFPLDLPQLEQLLRTEATNPQSETFISSVRIPVSPLILHRGARILMWAYWSSMSIISQYVVVYSCYCMIHVRQDICVIYHVEAKKAVYVNAFIWWNIKPSSTDKGHISVNKHSTTKALHFMNIKSDTLNPTSLVLGGPRLHSYC